MTVVTPPHPPRSDEPSDLDALIEEARRRARRRRFLFVAAGLVVFFAAGLSVIAYYLVEGNGRSEGPGARGQATHGAGAGELLLYGSLVHGHVIYGVRPDGSHLRRLTRAGNDNVAVSPDGKRIAFTRGRGPIDRKQRYTALFILNIESGRARRVTPWKANGTYGSPRWALGGRRIVYGTCRPAGIGESNCTIWSTRPDGSGKRNLTGTLKPSSLTVVSPDGRWIAFGTGSARFCFPGPLAPRLYAERIDGSGRRLLASGCSISPPPISWSRRGLIAYYRYSRGLETVSLGGRRQRFPGLPREAHRAFWSPDGSRLAVEVHGHVYVTNASGRGSLHSMNRNSRYKPFGAWSPDGRRIAYAESRIHGHTSVVVVDAGDGHVESVIPFRRVTDVVAWRR